QAWGTSSRFVRRSTERAPTKSGVIGLLAAAQGRERDADLSDLAALRFAVRLDQPGTRVRDFQTARHLDTDASMPVSERFYLSDAVFVAAVEGAADLVDELLA
ncbi:type I-E CRISPR-associated protein Cas5/CasD, partial [Streptomyces sp. SID11233]|nr:type I-E CRISPR-associated protein Cas5/CasD [Streptomyces sp. SID11233]